MAKEKEKILLALPPYWTPLIPPLGIASLKSFLRRHGYRVKTVDLNVEKEFRNIKDNYFDLLKDHIPTNKRGNFYNTGNDVLRNHMTVHVNCTDETEYIELVTLLVQRHFFCDIPGETVKELKDILNRFYLELERYFLRLLEEEAPAVLGLSVFNGTLPASLFIFKFTREKYPHIKTVMGGGIFAGDLAVGSPNLEMLLEKAPYVDKVIVGEGETLFLEYLQGAFPAGERVITLGDNKKKILDLSTGDIPDFTDFHLDRYPNMAASTSRGCPFQCSFCSETVRWGFYRKKTPKQVVEELKTLYRKYDTQLFLMGDSLLNPVISPLAEALIAEDISIYWDGYLRADNAVTDARNTWLWRRGGFYRARLGLESGSPGVLKLMGKKITPGQIKAAVSSLARAGIKTTTYWVIGHPGESERDFQQTLDIVEELRDDIYEADCNPFNYYYTGQVDSARWDLDGEKIPLYPEEARQSLILQTWILDREPSREETFRRINRFREHCDKLGIPNPYSLHDIHNADERWKRLHKNAVPSLIELEKKDSYIDENKRIKDFRPAAAPPRDDGNWNF